MGSPSVGESLKMSVCVSRGLALLPAYAYCYKTGVGYPPEGMPIHMYVQQ